MTFTAEQIDELAAPLQRNHVRQREQSGRKLSYIEGWWAIAEANRIFGFDGWHRETLELKQLHEPYQNAKDNWVVSYGCKSRVTVGGVVRDGFGFGSGIDKDLGRAHESAIKESETDSMKRALMTFGNPFGLALYDKEQANVAESWRGPLKVHALKTGLRKVQTDVENCTDEASLDDIVKAAKPLIEQAKHDLPEWIDGDGGDIRGLRPTVEMMRAEFRSREASKLGAVA